MIERPKRMLVLAGLSSLMLSACLSNETSPPAPLQTAVGPVTLASVDGPSLNALPNAALPEKSCGMVLWTLENSRPAAVFRFIPGGAGEINIDGRPITLQRVDFDGASDFGVFEHQVFENEDGLSVDVTARFGLGFNGGSYLERGLIKVSDQEGWSVITPTAGIAGCRN